ncbi:MAG: hypothetical protein MI892_09795 [Desulfobacterales bacterium]|nr:hypothetical protein [Desulfobacterales bacterium]
MDNKFSREEIEERKKAIFDAMGKRGQRQIMKKGYDKWDPFQEPKDPIDIRKDTTKRTSQQLIREFLYTKEDEECSNTYSQGAFEMCLGIVNDEERIKGMFDFACWYAELLRKEGYDSV